MATMQGVVLPGNRELDIREFPVPEPGPGEVLLRMRASSLCGSDLRAIYRPREQGTGPEAYQGVIAGHEPCGEVVALGSGVRRFRVGDRVVAYHIAGCGRCEECRRGYLIGCESPDRAAYGWQRHGGHAEYMTAAERTLVSLPDALTFDDGALVACGFGTAYAGCLRAAVSGRDRVLITGLGPVGLAAALLCRALGAQVTGVEVIAERVDLARKLGFEEIIEPGEAALAQLMELSGGHGFEVAIDCSAHSAARLLCLQAARTWGRVVLLGEGGTIAFEPSPLLIHKQLSLLGSWVCSISQMEELVQNLVRWQLHPDVTVTHHFPLAEAAEAYRVFDSGHTGKVVIHP